MAFRARAAEGRRQRRFGILLASLFALLCVAAFAQESRIVEELFLAALCVILTASLYAVEMSMHRVSLLMMLGLAAMGCNFTGYYVPGDEADILMAAGNLLFLSWVIALIARHIFGGPAPDADTVTGAACLYILAGLAFGFLYFIVDYFVPGSFHSAPKDHKSGAQALLGHFFYYSFATLTTVGYGDITPASQPARYLSVIEALMSQLYLAIVVSRLVGLHLGQRRP